MTPVRTCVGCGERAPVTELLRFHVAADGLAPDRVGRAPGRGAYLHRQPACWTAFARRRGAVRSLRVSPPPAARTALIALLAAIPGAA
ncbi:MAG: YlxR family protein [Candidatus Binatia bacterium]